MTSVFPESDSAQSRSGREHDDWRTRLIARSDMVRRAAERAVGQGENIIAVARSLYYETSGQPFSITQLTAKAGISLHTFYRYFASKDELLIAVLEEVLQERTEMVREAAAGAQDPVKRLQIALRLPFHWMTLPSHAAYAHLITREHLRLIAEYGPSVHRATGGYRELITELLVEAKNAGALASSIDPGRYGSTITDIVTSNVHNITLNIDTEDPDAVAEHVVTFCLRALGVTPAA